MHVHPKIAQKELSYNFETLHVVLSYRTNKIGTLKNCIIPQFSSRNAIHGGEFQITQKEKSYDFVTLHVVLSYQTNKNGTLQKFLITPLHPPL